MSGGVYKKSKKDGRKYYWEFIEPALRKISELSAAHKEKIIWLIADKGWDAADKKMISDAVKNYIDVRIKYVKNKKQIVNFFRYSRISKREKIHSLTVFSHGEVNRLRLGYDYSGHDDSKLYIEKKDINQFRKKSFARDAILKFYSCKTGANNFAYLWHKHLKVKQTMAYIGKTNYAGINGTATYKERINAKLDYLSHLFIGGQVSTYKPKKSKYYPEGKQMVLYTGKEKLYF